MKVSVKIEDDVKTDLVRIAGEYQTKFGKEYTISETIKQLIFEHKQFKQGA